jgi:hypothetical protein
MGHAISQSKSNSILEKRNQFLYQEEDYRWFMQKYPGEIKEDCYDERIVVTTFPNNLNTQDLEEYVDRKFSNLDDDIINKMKTLIKASLDANMEKNDVSSMEKNDASSMGKNDASSMENNKSSVDKKELQTVESRSDTIKEGSEEDNSHTYYHLNGSENLLSFDFNTNGKATATLIEILSEKSYTNNELKISIGYIKLTRKSKNATNTNTMENYWNSNRHQIVKALQYKYGKQLKRELNDGSSNQFHTHTSD